MNKIYKEVTKTCKYFARRIFVIFLVLTAFTKTANAQEVTLTATAGPFLTGSFHTVREAFNAINTGKHNGNITISINANTNEGTTPAVLNSGDADPANYTSVTIRPTADGLTVTGNPGAGFGVIELNGADNITIDGDNAGTGGTNRNLTINNTNTASSVGNSCIRIATSAAVLSANNITLKNCNLNGNVSSGNASGIINTNSSSNVSFGIYCGGNGGATAIAAPTAITTAMEAALSTTTIQGLTIDNNAITKCGRAIEFNGAASLVSDVLTVTNNVIGTAGALVTFPYDAGALASTVYVKGIWIAGTNELTISGNTVQNILSYVGTGLSGIELASNIGTGPIDINTNTITGVVNNNSSSGSNPVGIFINSVNGSFSIASNDISIIENNLGFVGVAGIQINSPGGVGTISENKVYALYARNTTSGAGANGIYLSGAANGTTIVNNFIFNLKNAGKTFTANNVNGILLASGNNHKIYHNSINLYGVSGATASTSINCLGISSSTWTGLDIRNNIFSNTVTGGTASDVHTCIFMPFAAVASMNLTMNNNAYYTGSVAGKSCIAFAGTNAYGLGDSLFTVANFNASVTTPVLNWRNYSARLGVSSNDNASIASTAAAPFVSLTDLHINTGATPTPLEKGGASVGIPSDIDAAPRNLTTPDIGADEFVGVVDDHFAPNIIALSLPASCLFTRTLTATITDATGVPTAGIGLPVLYWKINAGAYTPVQGVSIGGNQYTFNFGGGIAGDIISYYIVMQDNVSPTPNVIASPSTGAGGYTINPPATGVGLEPTTLYTVTNFPSLSGTYNVGPGQTYTTLTAAVNAYNISCLGGPVIFQFVAGYNAAYSAANETYPIVINANPFANSTNTLTIKPGAAVAATISGNNGTALIKFNGADYVTFDGLNSGGSSLTVSNTNTGNTATIFWIASASSTDGSTNNAIKNCAITGSGSSTSISGVLAGSGTTFGNPADAANSNNTVSGNTFKAFQNGLYISGKLPGLDQNWVISNNTIGSTAVATDKMGFRGLSFQGANNFTVSGNTINGVICGPTITSTSSGISIFNDCSNGNIFNNFISDVKQQNTLGFGSNGIYLATTNTASNIKVYNNFIWDVSAAGFAGVLEEDNGYGIMVDDGGGYSIYYNSVNMATNQTASGSITAAINISSNITTANSLNIRNNIFVNTETVGTRYSIYSGAAASVYSNIDYNDYHYGASPNLGFLSSARTNLAGWQTATGKDAHSLAVDPSFITGVNLHLNPGSVMNQRAVTGTGITTDIDGAARDVATPDIGADEFNGTPCGGNVPGTATAASASLCGAAATTLSVTGFSTGEGIVYQWQSAAAVGGPYTDIAGETNPYNLNTGVIGTTTYYRFGVKCGAGIFAYGTPVQITVNNPIVLTTTPNTRCGTGTVSLAATGSAGTTLNWYAAATGGSALFTGSPFTTPVINATTTFYVSASNGGSSATVGVPVVGTSCGTPAASTATDWPLRFNTTGPVTLVSAYCIPQAAGTFTVALRASLSTTDLQTQTFTFTAGEVGSPKLLPLNFVIATPGNYQITNTVGGVYRLGSGTFTCSYPFSNGSGTFSIVGSATFSNTATSTTQYNSFYDLIVSEGCESARTAVTATVTTAPAISTPTATPATICAGQSSTLAVSSVNDPNYTYTWTPGPVVGASVSVSPATTTTYTVNAVDNTAGPNAGCAATGTVTVTVNSVPGAVTVTPHTATVCAGGTQAISATGGNVNGSVNFTSGVISQTIPDASTTGTSNTLNVTGVPAGAVIDSVIVTANINFASFDADIILSIEAPNGQVLNLISGQSIPPFGGTNFTNTRISSDNTKPAINTSTAPFTGTFKADAATSYELAPTPLQTTTAYNALFTIPNGNWIIHAYDDEAIGTGTLVNWQIKIAYSASATFTWTPNNGTLNTLTGPAVIATPLATTTYYATATNAAGCTQVDSSIVTVNSSSAGITIAASPGNTICAGTSVTFTATPTNPGAGPIYQWYVGATLVQTGGLTYTTTTLTNGQVVTCQLTSNAACVVGNPFISNGITMTVNPNLPASITIAANPGNVICAGTSVTFTATPVNPGAGPIYQWYVGATLVQTGGLTYTTTTLTNGQVVTCVLTSNALCATGSPATSNAITMTVNPNLPASITIVANPSGSICSGTSVTFTATPVNPGAGPIYQWYVGATLVQTGGLTYTTTTLANGDIVTCVLTSNALCATGSPATSNAITMTVTGSLPASVTIASSGVLCSGNTITFTATPVNGGTPSYQWYVGATPMGPNSNVFAYVPANGDLVHVDMTTSLSCAVPPTASSNTITVALNPSPTVAPAASCLSLMLGNNTTLNSNAATASGTITGAQWYLGASPVGPALSPTLTVTATGSYTVLVTNSFGCTVTSSAVVVNPDVSPLIGNYTINPVGVACNNFTSIANAAAYANLHGLDPAAATVTFNVPAGYTETAIAGGISLGSNTLNTSVTAGKALVFQKSGVGANPKVTAFTPQATGAINDAVIKILGTDYVTFDGIDVAENASNSTAVIASNNMTEFGYGLFYLTPTDGAQNATIKNCVISLDITNANSFGIYSNTRHASGTPLTLADATASGGDNSNLKIYSNNISNVNNPISVVAAPAFPGAGLDIGGASAATANTISNFGSNSTFSGFTGVSTGSVNGISAMNEYACNISYNSIASPAAGTAAATLRGINLGISGAPAYPGAGTYNTTLNNNSISLKTATAAGIVEGIRNDIGNAILGLSISNNDFNNFTNTAGSPTGAVTFIINSIATLSQAINTNTFTALTINSTGNLTFISNNVALPAGGTENVNGNNIVTSFTKSGVGGTVQFYNSATASNATAVINNNNNNFSNMSFTSSIISGWINTDGGPGVANKTITGNTFSNITNNTSGAVTIMSVSGSNTRINTINAITGAAAVTGIATTTTATLFKNTISNLTAGGNCLAMNVGSGSTTVTVDSTTVTGLSSSGSAVSVAGVQVAAGLTVNFTNNDFNGFTSTGTGSSNVYGFQVAALTAGSTLTVSGNTLNNFTAAGATTASTTNGIQVGSSATVNIFKNKIYNLSQTANTSTTAPLVLGITISAGTAGTNAAVYNNFISDLRAPNSISVDGIRGISISSATGNTNYNLYYNTIYLNGSSGGANFGTTGIFHTGSATATTAALTLRNNIIVNESTPVGTGKTVAFRRGSALANLVNYGSTSNNNSFYAGTPGANNLIFYDGTNSDQTIAAFQTRVNSPARDVASINLKPFFVNIAATPYDLHLQVALSCSFDGQGDNSTILIPTDIDGDPRSVLTPFKTDIGADEFNGTGGGIGVWKGVNSDWMDINNWCGALPTATTNVTIPALATNYPIITAATGAIANDITIAGGGSITITGVGKLGIYGAISNSGTFNVVDGTIEMLGSNNQSIPNGVFQTNDLKNLIISNSTASPGVSLGGPLNIYGKLSFTTANSTFTTAGNLTLKSNAAGTANVGDITNGGTTSNNNITGDVTVERYISNRRAWRFLSPATQHNLQTIHESWQENQAANAFTTPGYGLQLTKDTANAVAYGYDMQTALGGTLKTYDPVANIWRPVVSTINVPGVSNGKFVAGTGYITLVRGDRQIITCCASNATVLREKGALITNNFAFPAIPANQFAGIGNPYPSAVDFTKLTTSNLTPFFYVWDPQLGTLGAYQTLGKSGANYLLLSPGGGSYGPVNTIVNNIQSGQAIFVRSTASAGSVSFTEPAKVDGSSLVSRPAGVNASQLRANLYTIDASTGLTNLFDGVLDEFDAAYSNDVDDFDAIKLTNFSDNMGIRSGGKILSVERKANLTENDTIFYNLGQVKVQNYKFEFIASDIDQTGLAAFLEDIYLHTLTPVSLAGTTWVDFNIVNDPGSYAADRFRLVFKTAGPVPVSFTNVRANRQHNDILVEWKVENELNIHHYEVERSSDGHTFSKVNEQAARGNNQGSSIQYSWLDTNPLDGDNFYRIRSVGMSSETKFSQIVKVNMGKLPTAITVFPNPVREDGILYISLENKPAGNYQVNIVNSTGQTVSRKTLNHAGGNSVYSITMDKYVAHGNYLVNVTGDGNVNLTFKIVY